MNTRPLGNIITFYSYKGGTGRSMALANLAWILASSGKRVLAIDWDLEAPGLHRYFRPFLIDEELSSSQGLIELVDAYASRAISPADEQSRANPDWYVEYADFRPYLLSVDYDHFGANGKIDLLPAGRQSDGYGLKVSSFNWQNLYDRLGGGGLFEALKARARADYDYVLIDSRTGVSDTAGICSVQMPDTLVVCFTLNNQSIRGAAAVAQSARGQRALLDMEMSTLAPARRERRGTSAVDDGSRPYRVFPVPMRVDDGESDRLALRRAYARRAFADLLDIGQSEVSAYWPAVEIPYRVLYSYEEVLATLKDDPVDPKSVLAALMRLTRYVTDGDVVDYRLLIDPGQRQILLEAFARTPLTPDAGQPLATVRAESEEETLIRTAEAAFGQLDDDEKHVAWSALGRLVRLGRVEEGGGYFPIKVSPDDFTDAERSVLPKLSRHGLVAAGTGPRGSQRASQGVEQTIALSDERLLKVWPRFLAWLAGDQEFLLWRQQLRTYLSAWGTSGRDRGALLSGQLLSEAEYWALKRKQELSSAEAEYIERSRQPSTDLDTQSTDARQVEVGSKRASAPRTFQLKRAQAFRGWRWVSGASVVCLVLVFLCYRYPAVLRPGSEAANPGLNSSDAAVPSIVRQARQRLIDEGDRLLGAGNAAAAQERYLTASESYTADADALLGLGRSYDALFEFALASAAYDQAVELRPNDATVLSTRGIGRMRHGDFSGAMNDLTQAITLDASSADLDQLLWRRAVARSKLDDLDGAMRDLSSAIQRKGGLWQYYFDRATLYERMCNWDAAAADYRRILAVNPGDENVRTVAASRLSALAPPTQPTEAMKKSGRWRVYLHYKDPADQKDVSELRRCLEQRFPGAVVAEPQLVKLPSDGDVRFFFSQDRDLATKVSAAALATLDMQGHRIPLKVVAIGAKHFPKARPGLVELWLPPLSRRSPAPQKAQTTYILWVDDNPQNNADLKRVFENAGARVINATNTQDAEVQLAKRTVGLVISDMGRGDDARAGYKLLQEVRKTYPKLPFIIYSSDGSTLEHQAEAKKRGANGSTNYPVELMALVQKHLPMLRLASRAASAAK